MHTPGPWTAGYDDNGFYYIHADGMPSPYIVATGGEGEADKANARLMSAAPDMLEALQGIVHFSDAVAYRTDTLSVALRQWIDAARAALTKATRP